VRANTSLRELRVHQCTAAPLLDMNAAEEARELVCSRSR
jgi:hypothetical protein